MYRVDCKWKRIINLRLYVNMGAASRGWCPEPADERVAID
jgi:hypothetical protein